MHLRGARVEEHLHDLLRRVAADDRVVDDRDALARDFGERVELQLDALAPQRLVGLDERARDVAVLDQPSLNGTPSARENPIAAGVPESGIGSTRSTSAGASTASRSPIRTRAPCTSMPASRVSGRAR